MIAKVVRKGNLKGFSEVKENLIYWLSKTSGERIAAVEALRRQLNGSSAGLQRSARVIQLPQRQLTTAQMEDLKAGAAHVI